MSRSKGTEVDVGQSSGKQRYLAFIALLGAGVDVNQRTTTGTRWTCLHWLFSKWDHGSVSNYYDYMCLAESPEFRFINALIKMGAEPLKEFMR